MHADLVPETRAARSLVVLAVLLSVAAVLGIARPPDTPPAIKRTDGWTKWWWTSQRGEDPLYRMPGAVAYDGPRSFEVLPGSLARMQLRTSPDNSVFTTLSAPVSGQLIFDPRDLDTVSGQLEFDLGELSGDGRGDGVRESLSDLEEPLRVVRLEFESSELGTVPRFADVTIQGEITLVTADGHMLRKDWFLTRMQDGSLALRSVEPLGWSFPSSFDRLGRLAESWGLGPISPDTGLEFNLICGHRSD